jgi:hypothetical protein
MKTVRLVIASNGVSYLQNEVGRIAQNVNKGEGRKEGNDGDWDYEFSHHI